MDNFTEYISMKSSGAAPLTAYLTAKDNDLTLENAEKVRFEGDTGGLKNNKAAENRVILMTKILDNF